MKMTDRGKEIKESLKSCPLQNVVDLVVDYEDASLEWSSDVREEGDVLLSGAIKELRSLSKVFMLKVQKEGEHLPKTFLYISEETALEHKARLDRDPSVIFFVLSTEALLP